MTSLFSPLLAWLVLAPSLHAEVCDVAALPEQNSGWQIELAEAKRLTVLAEGATAAMRARALELLQLRNARTADLHQLSRDFVSAHEVLLDQSEKTLQYLNQALQNQPLEYVGVVADGQMPPAELPLPQFNYWVQVNYNQGNDTEWQRILLAAIGPVEFAKWSRPDLFNKVHALSLASGALPQGEAIVITRLERVERDSLAMISACQKKVKPATLIAGKVPVADADSGPVKMVTEKSEKNARSVAPKSSKVTYHKNGTYSWYTTDRLGRRYKHVRRSR